MNRRVVAFVGSSLACLLLVLGYWTWERGALPWMVPTAHEVAFQDLNEDQRGVRVAGTAHYPARVLVGSGRRDGRQYHAFPLFDRGDIVGREIRVMVFSPRAPDPVLGFEDVTVTGLVRPAGNRAPETLRRAFELQGYRFVEDLLIIEVFDEPAG